MELGRLALPQGKRCMRQQLGTEAFSAWSQPHHLGKNLPKPTQCRSQRRKVTRESQKMICEEVVKSGSAHSCCESLCGTRGIQNFYLSTKHLIKSGLSLSPMELKFSPYSLALYTLAHTCTLGITAAPNLVHHPQYNSNCWLPPAAAEATRPEGACLQLSQTFLSPMSLEHGPWPHSQAPNTPSRMEALAGKINHLHKEFSGNLI